MTRNIVSLSLKFAVFHDIQADIFVAIFPLSIVPKELVFELHYLGSVEYSYSINFSRPAAPILAQYYNFLHLGFDGYRKISLHDAKNARLLARALENSKYYDVVSDIHRPKSEESLTEKAKHSIGLSDDIGKSL